MKTRRLWYSAAFLLALAAAPGTSRITHGQTGGVSLEDAAKLTQHSEQVQAASNLEQDTTMQVGIARGACRARLALDPLHPAAAGAECSYSMALHIGKARLISGTQVRALLRAAARAGHPYRLNSTRDSRPNRKGLVRPQGYYNGGWWYGYAEVRSCGQSSCPAIGWHVGIQYSYIASNDSRFQVWLQGTVACYNDYGGGGGWAVDPAHYWCNVANNGTQVLSGGDDYLATLTDPITGHQSGQIGSYQRVDVGAINGSPPVTWMEGPYVVSCHDDFYGNCTTN